ncbi:hypothetical protein Btru_032378 [Bulinus truncatus]|nr:hypothetical protein Btru_032378 [Bulinus truncatus]
MTPETFKEMRVRVYSRQRDYEQCKCLGDAARALLEVVELSCIQPLQCHAPVDTDNSTGIRFLHRCGHLGVTSHPAKSEARNKFKIKPTWVTCFLIVYISKQMKLQVSLMVTAYLCVQVHTDTADLASVVGTFTSAWQVTLEEIISENVTATCSYFTDQGSYQRYVQVGFCTENEFHTLHAASCGMNAPATHASSQPKLTFYASLNEVSAQCLDDALACITSSVIAIVLKEQEQFCPLLTVSFDGFTTEYCLTTESGDCTSDEFKRLKAAACQNIKAEVDHGFSDALINVNGACKSQLSSCGESMSDAKEFILNEQYCDAMKAQDDFGTMETCVTTISGCSEDNFKALKTAACDSSSLNLSILTLFIGLVVSGQNQRTNI